MNYGRYFRLNQALSKVVGGVAIYDYIDLPAYFGPSVDNPMSPKYPISVTITSDSICFRLHYSSFKIEDKTRKEEPRYAYHKVEDIDKKALSFDDKENPKRIRIAHMEEVILELPYNDNNSTKLSDAIKGIYNSKFPLQENEDEEKKGEKISYGGRFLEQLIYKRYPKTEEWKSVNVLKQEGDIETLLYGTLRDASDDSPSYSTLWLMDMMRNVDVRGYKHKQRIHLYDDHDGRSVIAFLRKLLLDFMFDLKHSDVFQNSANYQKMYSGLMSDFYFSALMHKCEYYYYRDLVTKEMDRMTNKDKEKILTLYGDNLRKSEELWTQDIMNPNAEKHFEHHYRANKWYHEIFGHYNFSCWPSWFAEPEEEMRRVCFTMIEKANGNKHICNTDTLVECLGLDKQSSNNSLAMEMIKSRDESYEKISKWFLKRYDFNDVLHLHIAKHFNIVVIIFVAVFLFWFFDAKEFFNLIHDKINELRFVFVISILIIFYVILVYESWKCFQIRRKEFPTISPVDIIAYTQNEISYGNKWKIIILICSCCLIYNYQEYLLYLLPVFHSIFESESIKWMAKSLHDNIGELSIYALVIFLGGLVCSSVSGIFVFQFKTSRLLVARRSITYKKIFGLFFIVSLFLCAYENFSNYKFMIILALIVFFVITYYNRWFGIMPTIHPISSLHLLFPRLVAAITAAWFAMSMGFDIYVSFFDQLPSWYTALAISGVVFGFIMYEINRIMPSCSSLRKIFRSFEFLLISYCISLLVGVVVINFVGEKYLERGGFIDDFHDQYVGHFENNYGLQYHPYIINNPISIDSLNTTEKKIDYLVNQTYRKTEDFYSKKVDSLKYIYHSKKIKDAEYVKIKDYPIIQKKHNIFFMRDFLIMFSFIAMFWGIFIQMIFIGDKQMTEL